MKMGSMYIEVSHFLNQTSDVDNLQPTEIVVSFSSLSRWPEPPPPPVEEKKSHTSTKGGKDKIDEKEITHITSSSLLEGRLFLLTMIFLNLQTPLI